jgi:hypothetical protein
MRFVVTAEWRENHLLRLILAAFVIYGVIFWLTNWLLYFARMELTYASVVEFYRGSEERFLEPRSYLVLLEISHAHLFAMGILILTLTHLTLFVPLRMSTKGLLVVVSFAGALLDEAGGWLIRFVHPGFAYVKITGFLALQTSLAAMLVVIGWAVWRTPPNAYRGRALGRDDDAPGPT